MLIVHIITRLIRAGADENTILTCTQQAAAGHDVVLIHGREFDPYYYERYKGEVTFICIDSMVRQVSPIDDAKSILRIYKSLKSLKPHVVHTHTSKAGVVGRLSARIANVPAVIHGVHIVPFVNVGAKSRATYLMLEKLVAGFTHAFINVSYGTRDLFLAHKVGKPRDHHVVHSGFDLKKYQDARPPEDWASLLDCDPERERPPVIVMMAALTARKRHNAFLTAFKRLTLIQPEVRLLICGDGEERDAIALHIKRLGLQKHALMLGFRPDPERLVALADICVLSSEREGLPRVIMQYLAGGKPCVVSQLPGVEEVLQDGVNGRVVAPEDVEAIADVIHDLLTHRNKLEALRLGAVATDLTNWNAEMMWPKMQIVYNEVLQKRGISEIGAVYNAKSSSTVSLRT